MSKLRRPSPKTEARAHPADTYIGVRIPAHLNDRLDAIARRESNGKSAVLRRLISLALTTARDDGAA